MVNFEEAARTIAGCCPGMRVRQASRVLARLYDDALRPLNVQASQLSVLVAVAMFGERGAKMRELADVQAMDRTTLTRNIRPLEKAGLLRVARSPEDARARVVLLTRAGERIIEAAYPLWSKVTSDVRSRVGATRLESVRDELATVVARLREPGGVDRARR
jgi:DNA-binding MarR family transcriptional regulator